MGEEQRGGVDRVVADLLARRAQRRVRVGELAGVGERVAERLPGLREAVRAHGEDAGRLQRAPQQHGGVRVREPLCRVPGGEPRVRPGLGRVAGAGVVERERRRELVQARVALRGQACGDRGVQPPPQREGQRRVRRVAHDGAAEAQVALAHLRDHVGEPVPRVGVGLRRAGIEDVGEVARVERHAEHGGAAHEHPLRGREPVDARERRRLDRVRERLLARAHRAEQVAEQLRVAAGALDGLAQAVRRNGR